MPIYEFTCENCGSEFEELVFGSSNEISCPSCGDKKVKKKVSVFGFKSGGKFNPTKPSCGPCNLTSCSSCK